MSVFSVTALDRLIESLDERTAGSSRARSSRLALAVEQCCSAASSFKSVASSYASSFKGSQASPSTFSDSLIRSLARPAGEVAAGDIAQLSATPPLQIPGRSVDQDGVLQQFGFSVSPGGSGSTLERPVDQQAVLSENRRALSRDRSRKLRNLLTAQTVAAGSDDLHLQEWPTESKVDGFLESRLRDSAVPDSGSCQHRLELDYGTEKASSSPHPSTRSLSGDEFVDASDMLFDGSSSDDESSTPAQVRERWGPFPGLFAYRELALQLQREIEKRKQVEGVVSALQEQLELGRLCSVVPLSAAVIAAEPSEQQEKDEEWQQKLVVARMLSQAIARGVAKAEAQEELDNVLGEKNRELSRYRDKIQYYETIIHEMSQINQQSIEMARQRRRKRQRIARWILGSVGAAVCLGLSAAAFHRCGVWEQIMELEWKSASFASDRQLAADISASHDLPSESTAEA